MVSQDKIIAVHKDRDIVVEGRIAKQFETNDVYSNGFRVSQSQVEKVKVEKLYNTEDASQGIDVKEDEGFLFKFRT